MISNSYEIWEWFKAAFIHDLGKTVLNRSGTWEAHERLEKTPYAESLSKDIIEHIAQHHDHVNFKTNSHSREAIALIMADRYQKGMHGEDLDDYERLSKVRNHPAFYPYYGPNEEGWDEDKCKPLIEAIKTAIPKELDLQSLLNLQKQVDRYPHTSHRPHLSLSLHHHFTALLFLFLIRKSETDYLAEQELRFSILSVTLEAMPLFYRLRDVDTHSKAIYFLRKKVFDKVFRVEDQALLPGLQPKCNPFEFFDRGNALVYVYDNPQKIINALQEAIDEKEYLRSLSIKTSEYLLLGEWRDNEDNNDIKYFWGSLSPEGPQNIESTLFAKGVLNYPELSLQRCGSCGKPQENLVLDIKGDMLCQICLEERKQQSDRIEVIDINQVSTSIKGKEKNVAYVFFTLKEPLIKEATDVAEKILSDFAIDRRVETAILSPSEGGLFEHLQALMDIQLFQNEIDSMISDFRKETPKSAYTLIRFPALIVYLMHVNYYWELLEFLNRKRERLRLSSRVQGIICQPKTPFWSLIMDQFINYSEDDYYYDATGGIIVMFTKDQVAEIRKLSNVAQRDWRSSSQLVALSRFALNRNLDELLLEIDVRGGQGKLARSLPDMLCKALKTIPGDEPKDQTKRAKFIDYVAKLSRAQRVSKRR